MTCDRRNFILICVQVARIREVNICLSKYFVKTCLRVRDSVHWDLFLGAAKRSPLAFCHQCAGGVEQAISKRLSFLGINFPIVQSRAACK